MEIDLGIFDIIKLGAKYVSHKALQYRLSTNETHTLEIKDGKLKGAKRNTVYHDDYWAFEGVPYAQPPLGDLRFRAPQRAEPWKGIRDCTKCSIKPMQKNLLLHIAEGSEDCLYLNVYAKKLQSDKPFPVMVFFYGGGFRIGEASRDYYAPDYFMAENVVLVTVNYRLGVFGFLSLSDPDLQVPGNAGLKDQLLALHWIKNNITHFNGDANNITIFGESAGGASTHHLMLCDRAEGLFHKAILQSGCALCPWAKASHENWAYRLARKLGYKSANNDKEVFQYLSKQAPSKLLVIENHLLNSAEIADFMFIAFGPVVEPYISEDAVITREPLESMRSTWSNSIPMMMGCCSFEGLFRYLTDKKLLKDFGNCERLLPQELHVNLNAQKAKEMGLRLKNAHFSDKDPSDEQEFFKFLDLMSYKDFLHGLHRTYLSRLAYASPTVPTFLYRFDYDSPNFNFFRMLICGKTVRGVCHADDLSYLFYSALSRKIPTDSTEFKTIQRMIAMWTAFATNSDPNCELIAPTIWQPARRDDDTPKCLNINECLEFIDLPEMPKLEVWNSLYERKQLY